MCAGALVHVRMRRVIFGCPDLRAGAAGSLMNLLQNSALNHRCEITAGVMHEECANLLQSFFRAKRNSEGERINFHTQSAPTPKIESQT